MTLTPLLIIAGVLLLVTIFWLIAERGQIILPSTLRLFRQGGPLRFLNSLSLHGYLYLLLQKAYAWAVIYIARPLSNAHLRNWITMRYHGKVLTHPQAREIISINEPIPLQDLEQVIPYPAARQILLEASPAITAYECACRSARPAPCQPLQVCLFIGEPYADFMLEHHPKASRRLSQADALELLDSEHARGHMHTAWFKSTLMERFYVLCNCCKCCCGGLEMMKRYGVRAMTSSGYVAHPNPALCAGCGTCVHACPFEALSLADGHSSLDWQRCMGCGVCVDQCPNHAIQLLRDERKGIPLEVSALRREGLEPESEVKPQPTIQI
jgi:ferredoxin